MALANLGSTRMTSFSEMIPTPGTTPVYRKRFAVSLLVDNSVPGQLNYRQNPLRRFAENDVVSLVPMVQLTY